MTICIELRKLLHPDYGKAYWHAHQDMTGIIAKKKHDKNIRIKKEFQYRGKSCGDSSGDTKKEDHTEGTTYVHKGADMNKEDGKKPVSDNENSDDRSKQRKINRRSAPFGKACPHTTTKSNALSTTSTSGRQLAPAQQTDTSTVHTSKTTPKKVSDGAPHDNDTGDGVYKMTDVTRKASPPLGTSSLRT